MLVAHIIAPTSACTPSVLGTIFHWSCEQQPVCMLLQCLALLYLVLTRKLQIAHRKGKMTKVKRMKACRQQQQAGLLTPCL